MAIGVALLYLGCGWYWGGHITCDFANQWLMGRMMVRQQWADLYIIGPQKEALKDGYEPYGKPAFDAMYEQILKKGPHNQNSTESDIEGPLYPPTMAMYMWPFAWLEPQAAHAVLVLIYAQLGLVTAWLLRDITGGKLSFGEAGLLVLLFPNFYGALILGQNAALTLLILTLGWALLVKGRPVAAGLVWGLFAYKPVFAVALIWVPLVLLNWRMLMGMVAGGAAFCLATIPVLGLQPFPPLRISLSQGVDIWFRWLHVGRNAAEMYSTDRNWVWMSRDLAGLPRRMMWDWESFSMHVRYLFGALHIDEATLKESLKTKGLPSEPAVLEELLKRVQPGAAPTVIGWCLLAAMIGITVLIVLGPVIKSWRRGEPVSSSPFAAPFLLLGALQTCYHFMHYDMLPMALPAALVIAQFGRLSWRERIFLILLGAVLLYGSWDLAWGGPIRIPFETYLIILLWGWLGYKTLTCREAGLLANGSLLRNENVHA